MNETRNSQLVQERERKLRGANFVIHGVTEVMQIDEDTDNLFVNELLRKIEVEATPVKITRLGKTQPNKNRPLKVQLSNEQEKEKVMMRLSNLKDAEERFKKISITDDYTLEERQEIKSWVDKAKEKNRK